MFDNALELLMKPGSVGVLPTDTVYGLVARASDQAAVERLYALKDREAKPGTVIAGSVEQLVQLGLKHRYLTAVEQFWPAALSVVIPCANPQLAYLHLGLQSLAVRIPDVPDLQQLLQKTGPLITTSANHPGQPTALTIAQAQDYFTDQVDFYCDGGDLSDHQPSTIIRVVDDAIEILRQGVVSV